MRRFLFALIPVALGCSSKEEPMDSGTDAALVDTNMQAACDGGPSTPGCPCEMNKPIPIPDCYDGPAGTANKGICKYGKKVCQNGIISQCMNQVLPAAETCNGLDDDCNGKIDDVPVDAGAIGTFEDASVTCNTSNQGVCKSGFYTCVKDAGAEPICVSYVQPMARAEECNALDDDCNGTVDEGLGDMGMCQVANLKGECAKGLSYCATGPDGGGPLPDGGSMGCKQLNFPKNETCNAKDDNCDGTVDNGTAQQLCGDPNAFCFNGTCFTCPYVFAHDGKSFAYETTVGGASLMGREKHAREGRDQSFQPMWARLDHAAKDGVVRAKLLAAEDEIVYFDAAKLTAIDAPEGYEVLSSTSIQWRKDQRDPQEFYALRTSAMRDPLAATWMDKDVTSDLSRADERAAAYDLHLANRYDLDFGPVRDGSSARLVIDGWKSKLERKLAPGVPNENPHLQIKQKDGSWKKAIEIGTPRGDKKTVAFSLAGLSFPTGRYQLRLVTGTHEGGNAMWYLDRVRLTEEPAGPITRRDYALSRADLSFNGAPTRTDDRSNNTPVRAVDDGKGEIAPEERTYGAFTRYGDVRELLGASDDRMVIMRKGDGVEMRFDGVARGKHTALFLMTDLLFKPRKWLSAERATPLTENVEPLPFHAMGHYPPSAPFPQSDAHRAWLRDYQTRVYNR